MVKVVIPYQPRAWQYSQHMSLSRFTVLVVHRGAGKTVLAINELLKRVLDNTRERPIVAYIAPTYGQAKKIAWALLKHLIKELPGVSINESELKVEFPNGGTAYLLGVENPDSIRGLHLDYVVVDEVGEMPDHVWGTILRPMLTNKKGGALFIGTPKGKNKFHSLYMNGKSGRKDWKSTLLTCYDTNAFSNDEIESAKLDMTDAEFEQEMMCSFSASIKGAYFAKYIERAENDERVTLLEYDPDVPVYTSWDIGLDGMALWFAQVVNNEVRIIDYLFELDKDTPEIVNILINKPYIYECQFLPHDGVKRSSNNKKDTPEGIIKAAGLRTKVLPRYSKGDSISIARRFLDKCIFSIDKTEAGLDSLRQYRAEFDDKTGLMKESDVKSLHNHPADSFCVLAAGFQKGTAVGKSHNSSRNTPKLKIKSDWKVFSR